MAKCCDATSDAMRSRMTLLMTTMAKSSDTALRWFLTRPLRPVAMALSMSPELTLFIALPAPPSPPAADAPQPMMCGKYRGRTMPNAEKFTRS